jgi:hypothetical protein
VAISEDGNLPATPRYELLSPAGAKLLRQDPERYAEEQRILAEDAGGWDRESRAGRISAAQGRA